MAVATVALRQRWLSESIDDDSAPTRMEAVVTMMHADGNERLRRRLFFYLHGGNNHIFPATLELPAATSNSTMEVRFPGSRRWRGESPNP
jgi:hypothetical protein